MRKLALLIACIMAVSSLVACGSGKRSGYGGGGGTWVQEIPQNMSDNNGNTEREKKFVPKTAAENACGDNAYWKFDSDTRTLYIEGNGDMWDFEIYDVVNDTVVFYFSTTAPWFENAVGYGEHIDKIVISDGITHIGDNAFNWYTLLYTSEVSLPSTLKSIGDNAFYSLDNVESLQLPDGLEYIGKSAFTFMHSLKEISIPESVKFIGDGAFFDNRALKTVNIPQKCTYFGEGAIGACDSLETVTVPQGCLCATMYDGMLFSADMKTVLWYPMNDTRTTLALQNGTSRIGVAAFFGAKLTHIDIPEGVVYIGNQAFAESALTNVVLPESLGELGTSVFAMCNEFESFNVPANVSKIGKDPFPKTDTITISPKNMYFTYEDGVLYDKNKTEILELIDPPDIYNVPSTVKTIGEKTFFDKGFEILRLPAGLENVHHTAFEVFDADEIIYEGSFEDWCKIGTAIYCQKFTCLKDENNDVKLSGTLNDNETLRWKVTNSGKLYIMGFGYIENYNLSWQELEGVTEVEFVGGVLNVPDAMLFNERSVEKVTLCEGMVEIGACPFAKIGLRSLHIPASVSEIAEDAFMEVYAMDEVTVHPDNKHFYVENKTLFTKGGKELLYCFDKDGKEYYVPASVEIIRSFAFQGTDFEKISVVNTNVKTIGEWAFSDCYNLTEITLPDSLVVVEDAAFAYDMELRTIEFPKNVEYIGDVIFDCCSALESITLYPNVEYFSKVAIGLCSNLKTIYFMGSEWQWNVLGVDLDTFYTKPEVKFIS